MKEIIKLILKYHFTIIFILLEVLSFSLIVLHNNYQRTVFSGYTASFFGTISSVVTRVDDYFYLKVTNEKLVAENTELRNEIEKLKLLNRISNADTLWAPTDSADVDYVYKTAEMINSSFNIILLSTKAQLRGSNPKWPFVRVKEWSVLSRK